MLLHNGLKGTGSTMRWTVICALLLAVAAGSAAPALSDAPAPAAVLTSCRGPVSVQHAGVSSPASFGLALHDGDEVKTGPEGEAEIVFSAGNWVQIGPNSSMKIKGRPAAASGATPDAADRAGANGSFEVVQSFLKLKSSEGTSAIGGLRSGEKPPVLEPMAPCQTRIRTARPVFRWRSEDPSLALKLTLYGNNATVWTSDVSGLTTAGYPADAPALTPGVSYGWTLETSDPLVVPPLHTTTSYFEIIPPADAQGLDTDLSQLDANQPGSLTYHLVRASLFFDRGLVDDAITETEAAVAADPENASLRTILGRLYAEAGRSRDAIDEWNRARP
jgi:hypothetical protein